MVEFNELLVSYSSGLLASISPCVIIFIPLILFKFLDTNKHNTNNKSTILPHTNYSNSINNSNKRISWDLIEFLIGFQLFYLLFSYILSGLLTSQIATSCKLGLGSLFLLGSILSESNSCYSISNMYIFKYNIITGAVFSLLLSFNPCSIPFLALILSMNSNLTNANLLFIHFTATRYITINVPILMNLFVFGQGLLTPSLIVILLGKSAFKMINNKLSSFTEKVKNYSNWLLAATGAYLMWNNWYLSAYDYYILILFALGNAYFLYSTLTQSDNSTKKSSTSLLYMLSALVLFFLFITFFYANSLHNSTTHEDLNKYLYGLDPDSVSKAAERAEIEQDLYHIQKLRKLHLHDEYEKAEHNENSIESTSEDDPATCIDMRMLPPCIGCIWIRNSYMLLIVIFSAIPLFEVYIYPHIFSKMYQAKGNYVEPA